jgi:hypothetical protein
MNYNAAHFRKEASVRLTLRASIDEKILRSAFPPPPDAFSPKPSLALSRIPATVLTSPWAGRQATLHDFAPQLLRAHTFCVPGGCFAPLARKTNGSRPCACRIQNSRWKTKTGGMSYEKV